MANNEEIVNNEEVVETVAVVEEAVVPAENVETVQPENKPQRVKGQRNYEKKERESKRPVTRREDSEFDKKLVGSIILNMPLRLHQISSERFHLALGNFHHNKNKNAQN